MLSRFTAIILFTYAVTIYAQCSTRNSQIECFHANETELNEILPPSTDNHKKITLFNITFTNTTGVSLNLGFTHYYNLTKSNLQSISRTTDGYYVQELVLEQNKLDNIDTGLLDNLNVERLSLANNQIVHIGCEPLSKITTLRYLNLAGNRLDSYTCPVRYLTELNLGYNQIEQLIPLADFNISAYPLAQDITLLEKFHLEYNRLVRIEADSFTRMFQLKELYLNDNQIVDFDCSAFTYLRNLTILNLSGNRLWDYSCGSQSLEELDLSNNRIQNFNIDNFVYMNQRIKRLNLRGNMLSCNQVALLRQLTTKMFLRFDDNCF